MVKNLGVFEVGLEDILMTVNNERRTWSRDKIEELISSIATYGLITPIILNKLEEQEGGKIYKIIGGNRRFISHKILKLSTILAKVYQGLTEEDAIEMHMIENVTKRKIAPHSHAESYWDLYKILLAERIGFKGDEILEYNPGDYWTIDEALREKLTLAEFSRHIGRDSSTLNNAFQYIRVNKKLKDLVSKKKAKYSVVLEFGKINDKNEQMILYNRAQIDTNGKLNSKTARRFVNNHIRTHQENSEILLTVQEKRRPKKNRDLLSGLEELITFKKKFKFMSTIEDNLAFADLKGSNGHTMQTIFDSIKQRVYNLIEQYSQNEKYLEVEEEQRKKKKKKKLIDRIKSGEVELNGDKKGKKITFDKVEYLPKVNLVDIVPCPTQLRTDFDDKNILDMAGTIKKYGIMQPIMVRPNPNGEGYEIVVGENRYWAAAEAEEMITDVLFVEIDDVTAHIIRAEEDLYEEVILTERAEKLMENYELKKSIHGEDYSVSQFAKELGLSSSAITDALKHASLDADTKYLTEAGLISFTQGVLLSDIGDVGLRKQYAAASIMLGLNVKDLKQRIYSDAHQQTLPFGNYDLKTEKIKGLHRSMIEKADNLAQILRDERLNELNTKDAFRRLYELKELVDSI